jgi:uncharacterized SAM-binding protein YcdF (DUF218 family)
LAALCLAFLAGLTLWSLGDRALPALARWLDVGSPPHRVDAAFILPGDQSVRPFVAAALVKRGYADRALFPKNAPSPETIAAGRLPTDELIRRVLEQRGLAPEQIVLLDGDTISTEDDLLALGRYLRDHPQSRVAVVTSHYHTRRTRLLTNRLLGQHAGQVSFVSAPTARFDASDWWRRDDGFFSITSEYLKLAYSAVRHTRLAWWAVALAIGACCAIGILWKRRQHSRSTSPSVV